MSINFTQIASTVSAVVGLMPIATSLVQAVEATLPAGTPGAAKLDVVKVGLQSAYNASGTVATEFATIWPHLQAIIAAIVAALNSIGVFKKSAPAVAAPAA